MAKIRQEINILNATITATSVGFAVLDTGKYSGTVTYQFEIVGLVSSGTATVTCQRNGTTTNDATISLTATAYTRSRATLTPPEGATEYRVAISGGTGPQIRSARIIVFQDTGSGPVYATETQIEIGGQETQLSTTNIPLTAPKYWYYDSSKWSSGLSFFAEVVGKRDTSTMSNSTWVLQEDNGSFGSWADKVTIASSITTTTATDYKVAFAPTNDRNYRIVSRDSDTMNGGHVTYAAKIVVSGSSSIAMVGNSFSTTRSSCVAAMTSSLVAAIDLSSPSTESLVAYSFNGTNWSKQGNGIFVSSESSGRGFSMTAMSSSRVAVFIWNGAASSLLNVYDFDGTNWSKTGNTLTVSAQSGAIAYLDSSIIAVLANSGATSTGILRNYSFDGTNWTTSGSSINVSSLGDPAIAALSPTRIATIDSTNDLLRAYDYSSSSSRWAQVGSSLSVSGAGSPSLAGLSSSMVVFLDDTLERLRVYDFNGSSWVESIGLSLSPVAFGHNISSMSSSRIALVDSDLDLLSAYDIQVAEVSNFEPQYLLINQSITTTGLQDFDTLFDPADWTGSTVSYFHESNADGASSAVKLQTNPNVTPADIASSSVTGANRQRSSALTMPGSSATIDANVTTA